MRTIDRERLEGAIYAVNANEYVEGIRTRANFIKVYQELTPTYMIERLCDSVIGYTNYANQRTNKHIVLHQVWFDMQGLDAEQVLNSISDKYNWWQPIPNTYMIYEAGDENKGITERCDDDGNETTDLFREMHHHHITYNQSKTVELTANLHMLFHGLYGKVRYNRSQLVDMFKAILTENKYVEYLNETDLNLVKHLTRKK